jgi:hypothetical protein
MLLLKICESTHQKRIHVRRTLFLVSRDPSGVDNIHTHVTTYLLVVGTDHTNFLSLFEDFAGLGVGNVEFGLELIGYFGFRRRR